MIKVIDAMCGAGKSTAMLKMMNGAKEKKWLYITPFLSEIEERLPNAVPDLKFKSPESDKGTKLADITRLVERGENIASTHALFKMFTSELVDMIIEKDYIMVIDEAVDAVTQFKGDLHPSDIQALLTGDFVSYDESDRNKLVWNEEKYPVHEGKYTQVRDMCNNGMLYCYKEQFLMCEYPPKLLGSLSHVFVLTYMFKGCTMRYWLDINEFPYEYVDHDKAGLKSESELKKVVRENLEIISNRTLDTLQKAQTAKAFSVNWFNKLPTDKRDKYKAVMRSCVVAHKVGKADIFWTTYKQQEKFLAHTGYRQCFLPLTIKATNDYQDKSFCMYAVNLHSNPIDTQYVESLGVEIGQDDMDIFCLSNLIQFMFRGTIRQGKPMKILILSKRVRRLLEQWLNDEGGTDNE